MSLVGIDFGNTKGVVALVRRKGIDVVNNEQSKRESDSFFSFSGKQRLFGYTAKAQEVQNYENTLTGMKSYLGLNYEDPQFQEILPKMGWKNFIPLKDGEVGYSFDYGVNKDGEKEQITLSSTQIGSQMFKYLKEVGKKHDASNDCVLSYPSYYSDRRKIALKTAAEITGIRVLSMISEPKAICLTWGFPKKDLPEKAKDAETVCFVDFGHSHITATVASFTKNKIQILAESHSTKVGGREIDWKFFHHVAKIIEEKFKIKLSDIQRKKSLCRFLNAVIKAKVMLSSAPKQVPFSVDCLHNDRDIFLTLQRDEYEELITPIIDEAIEVVKRAIKLSKKDIKDIKTMEIVGGSSRIPLFKSKLQEYYGKTPSMTLNATECVARGCAYHAAILSPLFMTKSITFKDSNIYPILLCWKDLVDPKSLKEENKTAEEEEKVEVELKVPENPENTIYEPIELNKSNSLNLVKRSNIVPTLKEIKFTKSVPFRLQAQYGNPEFLGQEQPEFSDIPSSNTLIGTYDIKDVPMNTEKPSLIKVRFEIDNFGIFKLRSVNLSETVMEEVKIRIKKKAKPQPPKKTEKKETEKKEEEKKETEKKETEKKEEEKKEEKTEEKKETENKEEEKKEEEKKEEETETKKKEEEKTEENKETEKKEEEKEGEQKETEKKEEEKKEEAKETEKKEKEEEKEEEPQYKTKLKEVEKLRKLNTNIVDFSIPSLSMEELIKIEYEIEVQNKIIVEKLNMKNSLESYIYDLRNNLWTTWKSFVSEKKVNEIMGDLDKMEDWIYGDGFDVSKDEYENRLKTLKKEGDPIQYRFEESQKRPQLFQTIHSQVKLCLENLKKDEFDHLEEDDTAKIENYCKEMKDWAAKKQEQQKKKQLYEDIVISSQEIQNKFKEFFNNCKVIFSKPRPEPKKEEKKEEEKKDEEKKDEEKKEEKKDEDKKDEEKKDENEGEKKEEEEKKEGEKIETEEDKKPKIENKQEKEKKINTDEINDNVDDLEVDID
ncbi:hsc70cb isoform g-related [Anaeramoeba flamelloides]|uniref:Hsc70cb isoform g-related n=1 Tax=Anaeramoeba flamelloides TaxID=1746091 RepID=A0AAV7Z6J0_9EUKA|nr:hsc70cb isoform g-related [Anaeramoeba flamelloides]